MDKARQKIKFVTIQMNRSNTLANRGEEGGKRGIHSHIKTVVSNSRAKNGTTLKYYPGL